MISFFKNTSSLYHYLCGWFLKQNIEFDFKLIVQIHHLIPIYQIINFGFTLQNSNVTYNLISVPYFIHMMLHVIRYLEFNTQEDYTVIKNLAGYLKKAFFVYDNKQRTRPCFFLKNTGAEEKKNLIQRLTLL